MPSRGCGAEKGLQERLKKLRDEAERWTGEARARMQKREFGAAMDYLNLALDQQVQDVDLAERIQQLHLQCEHAAKEQVVQRDLAESWFVRVRCGTTRRC